MSAAPNGAGAPSIECTEHRLGNGLRVLLAPDGLAPVVAVNLWYDIGSKHEVAGRTGIAHLFEHMMFQGSRNVPKGEHFRLVDGGGGTCNASTWFHRTNYFETGPATQLPVYLWLEADRMGGLLDALGQETLDNQRDVVKNEKRQRYDDPPYGTAWLRMIANLFPEGHPYHHPTIGSMEDLDAATVEDCRAFFQTYYAPGNAVLTVCGEFDPTRTLDDVEHYFGQIPAGPVPPAHPPLEVARHVGTTLREEVVDRAPLPRVYVAFRAPAVWTDEADALTVAGAILSLTAGSSSTRSTRLYRTLVRERQVAQDVAFGVQELAGTSIAYGYATARPGVAPTDLERALLEQVYSVAEGVGDDEIARAQAGLERAEIQGRFLRAMMRADSLGEFATVTGDPADASRVIPRIRAITAERVRAAAAATFRPDNLVVLTFVPKEES